MSSERRHGAPQLRAPTVNILIASVRLGAKDVVATPGVALFSASFSAFVGIFMAALTISDWNDQLAYFRCYGVFDG